MELSIEQRLLLAQVVSELNIGSYELIKKKKELLNKVLFTDKEMKEVEMEQEKGEVRWKVEKEKPKTIDLSPYNEVLEKGLDAFKAVHENKQDWTDALVVMADMFELSFLSTVVDKKVDKNKKKS